MKFGVMFANTGFGASPDGTTTLRWGSTSTPVPRRIRSVWAAAHVSQMRGSGRSNASAPPAILPLGSYGYLES